MECGSEMIVMEEGGRVERAGVLCVIENVEERMGSVWSRGGGLVILDGSA